jgi:hypothetical protein
VRDLSAAGRIAQALLLALFAFFTARAAAAQTCVDLCGMTCIKPWSIPDRWDDVTPVAGYQGGIVNGKRLPNWRGNGNWDSEPLTNDVNGNHLYDPGDTYEDSNANGAYDSETYDSALTGYVPSPYPGNLLSPGGDLGLALTIRPPDPSRPPQPGQYLAVDLPPINRGTPITGDDEYRDNMMSCNAAEVWPGDWLRTKTGDMTGPTNQAMRDLIAQDPDAFWDPITQGVQGSQFVLSPRVVLLPVFDPRVPLQSGSTNILITKVVAFFMAQMDGSGEVAGYFMKVAWPYPGASCPPGTAAAGSFVVSCEAPTAGRPSTWGQVKSLYRK